MLRTVRATRYVTPLREGGSLPAIIEADDLGLYVLKFRGAGQGPLALTAELISGEIGRLLGLKVPEIVFTEVDAVLGRNEPDEEIRDLLRSSEGLNLALDYLPGSTMFDPAAGDTASPDTASRIVWLDAFTLNVDRTPRNANLLIWHKELHPIDHGASLYVHHNWKTAEQSALSVFAPVREHLLLPWASAMNEADEIAHQKLDRSTFSEILDLVPEQWLTVDRSVYIDFLARRLDGSKNFTEEAAKAHAAVV